MRSFFPICSSVDPGGEMRRWCHAGMGWSVAISCFCEIGEADTRSRSAVMLCSSGMGLFTKRSPYRLPQIPKKHKKKNQAEHSVMRTVTKNTLQSQRCGLVELHGRLCGKMLLGNWVLFCNRLCSARSEWASKCRLRSFVCVAVSVYRPHVC